MKILRKQLDKLESQNKYSALFCFEEEDFESYGLKPCSILSVFQFVSLEHAIKLGVGFNDIIKQNLLWVTMRIKYQLLGNILPNQYLKIVTYPSGKNMMEYDRDYIIFDENGNMLAKGQSKWCLIDTQTRRIKRMIDCPVLENIPTVFEGKFLKTDAFEPSCCPDLRYGVKHDDIDNNGHVNNIVYAKILDELLQRQYKTIKFFQINFLKELVYGDMIDVYTKPENNAVTFVGKKYLGETSFSAYVEFGE